MNSAGWDPKVHSKRKLGYAFNVPVSPTLPIAAQVCPHGLHLQLDNTGAYLTADARGLVTPGRVKAIKEAMANCAIERSYSGSHTMYYRLTVKPVTDGMCELYVGESDTLFCKVMIDPSAELVSTDEPLSDQLGDGSADEPEDQD